MIALLQRVKQASVQVDGVVTGQIDAGLLVFLCAEKNDTPQIGEKLLKKVLSYRMFSDENGKMNLNVQQVNGGLLVVSQFTLAADTNSGTRASFTPAAAPDLARALYDDWLNKARAAHPLVQAGIFAADMQVALVNDGPVTFWLSVN